jgi:hypothetical protein
VTSVLLLLVELSSGADLLRHTAVKLALVLNGLEDVVLVNLTGRSPLPTFLLLIPNLLLKRSLRKLTLVSLKHDSCLD